MVILNVIGRMVVDAELVSKDGRESIRGRFAVDDYDFTNKEKTTAWFSLLIDANDRNKNLLQYMKKGSMFNIVGTESVRIYTDKEGNPQVGRDIKVSFLDFVKSGGSGETATHSVNVESTPKVDCGVLKQPTLSVSSADDDLPF